MAHRSALSYDVSNNRPEGSEPVGEFGNKFREAREKKELSLDDVSNVTKISSRMLQAIEGEQFDQLPGGVFNKGFIRAYAKHLGLNSDEAVSDYLACLRQAQIDSHAAWDAAAGNGRASTQTVAEKKKSPEAPTAKTVLKPLPPEQVEELPDLQLPRAEHVRPAKKEFLSRTPSSTPRTLIAFAAIVLMAGIFFWMRHSRAAQHTTGGTSAPTVTASAAASTPAPAASVPVASASVPAVKPVAPSQQQPAVPESTPVAAPQSSTPPAADPQQSTNPDDLPVARSTQATPAPADPNEVKVQKKGDVTIRSFGTTSAKPAEKSAATLTLVVRASENSWISVTSDGQLVTQETLIAPAATSFHASRELIVRVGNAAGVSFLWNGDELAAQGAEAEAKTFVFDSQGMRASTPPTQVTP